MDKPRPYTVEEMREQFLRHLMDIRDYWTKADISRPEFQDALKRDGEVRYRMEGMLFSILVMFDGGSGMMPSFDIRPSPHPADQAFRKSRDENWWTHKTINNTQLHEELCALEAKQRKQS